LLLWNRKSKSTHEEAQFLFKEANAYLQPFGINVCAIIPPGNRLLFLYDYKMSAH